MASSSEIEKLERRYAENPEGRFFAPLADAYRKAGQVNRALELVRAGLQKHPDYLSAHIVLGRCLLDADKDAEAANTFQGVLQLDAENIIALKSLAEIAERGGRPAEAVEWLRKLLVVDSMNAEAEADLARLGGMLAERPTQPVEAAAAPVGAAEAGVSFADVTAEIKAELARASAAAAPAPAAALPVPESPAAASAAAEAAPAIEAAAPAPRAAGAEVKMPPRIEPAAPMPVRVEAAPPAPPAPLPQVRPAATFELLAEPRPVAEAGPPPAPEPGALEVQPFDDSLDWGTGERTSRAVRAEDIEAVAHDETVKSPAAEFASGIEATPGQPSAQPEELPLEREDRSFSAAAEAAAAAVPANAELPANLSGAYSIVEEVPAPPRGVTAAHPAADLPLIMPEDVTPPEELKRPSAKLVQMVSPAPVREEGAAVPEPMLTETMADLYLRQGFRSEAVDVYRRLLSQRPGDTSLAAKLRAAEAPPPNLSAAALGAESVAVWLKRVATSRLPERRADAGQTSNGPTPLDAAFSAPAPEPVGEPAHPAPEAFSLEQIFGSAPEVPPATAEGSSAPHAPPPGAGTSFDEFFGQPGQGSVRPADKVPERLSRPDDEDLGEFNAWLQSLKK
jgi:tetratricopeptide (TPR) repeat protein